MYQPQKKTFLSQKKCFGILNIAKYYSLSYITKSLIYLLFIKAILELYDSLYIICEPGDTQNVDRGFRDVPSAFEHLGFYVKMPVFLQKGANQLHIEQAHETRMITKTRWVIESSQSQLKKWHSFRNVLVKIFL